MNRAQRMSGVSVAIVSALVCAVPCFGQTPPSRTDSAGISIVLNQDQDVELGWRFAERFRLGGEEEGPEAFYRVWVGLVATAADGTITVLDGDNYRVVQFSSDGEHLRSFGGEGEGPGEFSFPIQVVVDQSGLVAVHDVRKRALVPFDLDGQPLPEVTVAGIGLMRHIAIDGDSLFYEVRGRPRADGTRLLDVNLAVGADTSVVASSVEPPSTSQMFQDCGVSISLAPVLSNALSWRYSGRRLAFYTGPSYTVEILAPESRTSLRRGIPVRRATEALARRSLGEGMKLGVGASRTCLIPAADLIEQAGIAETVPSISDLALAPDGTLWVKRWTFPDEPQLIDIFDSEGVYVGTLVGPKPFPLAFLPNGDVLAAETDDVGLQRLVVYSVSRD